MCHSEIHFTDNPKDRPNSNYNQAISKPDTWPITQCLQYNHALGPSFENTNDTIGFGEPPLLVCGNTTTTTPMGEVCVWVELLQWRGGASLSGIQV